MAQEKIKLTKTIYGVKASNELINNSFSELATSTNREEDIRKLFNLYNGWASETNNIANKIMQECEKDTNYLFDIVHEYLQLLENTPLGLKGIKETLEEREN